MAREIRIIPEEDENIAIVRVRLVRLKREYATEWLVQTYHPLL